MARALSLASRGLYSTHPNPRVGCVLVREDEIVGEGWHHLAGSDHAERLALKQAGERAAGADCYVTLEPCNHHGKTPPCTEALLASGVRRLIAAMPDPDPRTVGRGLAVLSEAGMEVTSGLMQEEAMRLNSGFIKRMTRGLPRITSKIAASLDGRTAMPGGDSKWITSEAARADVQRLRAASSAVLTGIGTILADDPQLNVRQPIRDSDPPLRIVLDRRLRTPATARTLSLPGRVVIFTCADDADRIALLKRAGAEVVVKPEKGFLESVLQHLAQQELVNDVLVEAGPTLNGALLRAGHIDEVILYQAAVIMGDRAAGMFHLPSLQEMPDRLAMRLSGMRRLGPDIRLQLVLSSDENVNG